MLSPFNLCYNCLILYSEIEFAVSCFCLSVSHLNLFVSGRRAPFNISYNAGLVVVNFPQRLSV